MGDVPLVIIPARIGSTRLPRKALADIAGEPMVVHVWRLAVDADVGPVHVATDDQRIAEVVLAAGGSVVMTLASHLSGTDRVREAANAVDPGHRHGIVVNLQGDVPAAPSAYVARACKPLERSSDIGTLVAKEGDGEAPIAVLDRKGMALYFSRCLLPCGYPHIGIYAFRRSALDRFCNLPPGRLERAESLEQLRALEHGMTIGAEIVDQGVRGVDTPEDLAAVRRRMAIH